jgi:hypothetical protein
VTTRDDVERTRVAAYEKFTAAGTATDRTLETLASCLAIAWLVRVGDPYDGRRVERITLSILDTLERQR